jgi:hypothetical protein
MSDVKLVPVPDLLFDPENPRLSQPNIGQREAWRALATLLDRRLLKLAEHIVEHGIDPATLPIVMPSGDDTKRYIVLEGNRRLAALKALENPEGIMGAVPQATLAEMRRLSKRYHENPLAEIRCTVVKTRAEADIWIELRHSGQSEGAGVIPWGSDEAARFRARSGQIEPHTQALNFLETLGHLTPEQRRKIPATSFKRLIETPAVRAKLGIAVEDGQLRLLADARKVSKALMYIVNDLISGKVPVSKIYHVDQRQAYANKLPKSVVVKTSAGARPSPAPGANKGLGKAKTSTPATRPRVRDTLIPSDCILKVTDTRTRDVEGELRRLSLSDYPNAIGVLFRVFLELSSDAYITTNKLAGTHVDQALQKKLFAVASHLIDQKKLTSQQVVPVRRACARDSFLAPSITLMHQFVHNPHIFPAAGDLRAYWNSLQPFVMAIWSP